MTYGKTVWLRYCAGMLAACVAVQAGGGAPPLSGIAHVALRVANLEVSRAFYRDQLGLEQSFEFADSSGRVTVAFLKINDHQFLELYPITNPATQRAGLMHICLEAEDIEAARTYLLGRDLTPSAVSTGRAGNMMFSLTDPDGQVVEYTQYRPGSKHSEDAGKHLGERRIAARLLRATTPAADGNASRMFYMGMLGFEDRGVAHPTWLGLPGADDDIELSAGGMPGWRPKLSFGVEDLKRAAGELRSRGLTAKTASGEVLVADPDGGAIAFVEQGPVWSSVANRLVGSRAESYGFEEGEGIQALGLARLARVTRDARYAQWAERWAKSWESHDLGQMLEIGPVNARGEAGAGAHPGDSTRWTPGAATAVLYPESRTPGHLKAARAVAQFIVTKAERSPEGALASWHGSHQIAASTLIRACPLLAALGEQENKSEYVDEAAAQILAHWKRLEDPATHLLWDSWDWQSGAHGEGGRGWTAGAALAAMADTLEAMKKRHSRRGEVEQAARTLEAALAKGPGGAKDDPAAAAIAVYARLKLARLGVIGPEESAAAWKTWQEVNLGFVKGGRVMAAGEGQAAAAAATGAYLLAASEAARAARRK